MRKKYPGFDLTKLSPNDYYESKDFVFRKHKSDIFVMIKLPIAHKESPKLKLFSVISFPVPINSSLHATQLMNHPKYIALSTNSNYYTILSSTDMARCTQNDESYCSFAPTFMSSENSCVLSILNNMKDKVKKNCDFRFLHNGINPRIIMLRPSLILIYEIHKIILNCAGK